MSDWRDEAAEGPAADWRAEASKDRWAVLKDDLDAAGSKAPQRDALLEAKLHAAGWGKRESPDTSDEVESPKGQTGRGDLFAPKSSGGAFAHGVVKGGTLGFADELYGAIAGQSDTNEQRTKIADDVDRAKAEGRYGEVIQPPPQVRQSIKRPGQPDIVLNRPAMAPNDAETPQIDELANYRSNRDSLRGDMSTAEQSHPSLFHAGEFAGAMAVPLPGPGKVKGLAKVGKYALQGAGVGAASGLGNSDADLTQGDVGQLGHAALDTGVSGLGGAAVGGVLGYGASKLDPILERTAARNAYKALDPYMKTVNATLREKLGRDASPAEVMAEVERLGRRTLDEGVVPEGVMSRWANSETLGNRAAAARDETGQLKGAFTDMAQDQLEKQGISQPVRPMRMAREIDAEATKAATNEATRPLARPLQREAEQVRQAAADRVLAGQPLNRTLPEAERTKTALQDAIYGLDAGKRGGPTQQAKEIVARIAKEQAERAIEQGLGPEDLAQFQALKGKYGDLAKIAQTANYGALRSFRNNQVGLGDKLAAQVGAHAASGGASIPAAIAAGAAHHVVNNRGAAALARTLSNMSQSNQSLAPLAQWESLLLGDDERKKREAAPAGSR